MDTEQKLKNEFMIELRNHLMKLYKTTKHYTLGESNLEAKTQEHAIDTSKPQAIKDITGFFFIKNLCEYKPQNANEVVEKINEFYKQKTGIENTLEKNQKQLRIKLDNREYFIVAYVSKESGGGDISVHCTLMPYSRNL
ncbi:MAG: hypothetical protein ACP5N1_06640 [Candidatus Woesearchaeota archaeon]